MRNLLGRGGALAASILAFGSLTVPAAQGSEVRASDPQPSIGPPAPTSTPSTSYRSAPTEFALTVSPTRLVIGKADFGTVSQILIVNRGRSATPVTVQERNFVGRSDGTFGFQQNAPYAASAWLTVNPLSFTVLPGATQVVSVTYRIPPDAEPGDHQVALVFLVPSGHGSGNVRINRGVATPIYITIPGSTTDSVSLNSLRAPGFAISGPVTLTATLHETGSVHRDFRGPTRLVVHAAGGAAAFPDFTVLRDSTRDVSTRWNPPLVCICHPSVSVTNPDRSVQTIAVRVVVFPVHLLGALLGLLAALIVGLRLRRHRRATAGGAAPRQAAAGKAPASDDD
jgi:hypothetical protein